MALNSHRNLGMTGLQQARSSQRLSSGFRINSAADDAAGLGISEKMRAQIRGLDQAARNAQDGISLIQTAEGAMGTINDMVKRIRDLVVQAANDTNAHLMANEASWSQSDRTRIQDEINQLLAEIDGTVERTEFNTRRLLDGSLAAGSDAEMGKVTNAGFDPGASAIVKVGDQWVLNQAAFEKTFDENFDINVTDKMNAWAVEQGITGVTTFDQWMTANAANVGTTVNTVVAPFSPAQVMRIINENNHRDPATASEFGTLRSFVEGLMARPEFAPTFASMNDMKTAEEFMRAITLGGQNNFVNTFNHLGGLNGNAQLGTQLLVHLDDWANQYIVNGGKIATAESIAPQGIHHGADIQVGQFFNGLEVMLGDLDPAGAHYNMTLADLFKLGGAPTLAMQVNPGAVITAADVQAEGPRFADTLATLAGSGTSYFIGGREITTSSLTRAALGLGVFTAGTLIASGWHFATGTSSTPGNQVEINIGTSGTPGTHFDDDGRTIAQMMSNVPPATVAGLQHAFTLISLDGTNWHNIADVIADRAAIGALTGATELVDLPNINVITTSATGGNAAFTAADIQAEGPHHNVVIAAGMYLNGLEVETGDPRIAQNLRTLHAALAPGETLTWAAAGTPPTTTNITAQNLEALLKPAGEFHGRTVQIGISINMGGQSAVEVTASSIATGGYHHNQGFRLGDALAVGMNYNGRTLSIADLADAGDLYKLGMTANSTLSDLMDHVMVRGLTVAGVTGPGAAGINVAVSTSTLEAGGRLAGRELRIGDTIGSTALTQVQVTAATLRGAGEHFGMTIDGNPVAVGDRINSAGTLLEGAGFLALIGRSEFQETYGNREPGTVHLSFLDANATAKDSSGGPQSIAERVFDVLAASGHNFANLDPNGPVAKIKGFENFADNRAEIVRELASWLKDEFGGFAGAAFKEGVDVSPDNAFTVANMVRALTGDAGNPAHDGQGLAAGVATERLAEELVDAFDAWAKDYITPDGQKFDDFTEWAVWAFTGTPGTYFEFDSVENKINYATNGATIGSIVPEFAEEVTTEAVNGGQLWFQIGANAGQGVKLNIESVDVAALSAVGERGGVDAGFSFADLRSTDSTFESRGQGVMKVNGEDISNFLTAIDFALSHATSQRSNLGAMQNRLEFTIENLNVSSENLSAAESRIRDADMAKEMMRFTQSNILQQAAISMLAQANQAPNMILSLLR
jgi:flagellin